MAKAPTGASREAAAARRKPSQAAILGWIVAPVMVIVAFPTVLLLLVGMAPTVAAAIIDRHPAKYTTRTVGYANLCGCLPYAIKLWAGTHSIESATTILSEPLVWLVMYGAAAAGWIIYFSVPPFVAAYLAVTAEVKEKSLKSRQQELVDEWGPPVRQRATGESADAVSEDGAGVDGTEENGAAKHASAPPAQ